MRLENFICDSSGVYRTREEGTPAGYMDGAESYLLEVLGKSRDLGIFSSELKSCIRDWPSLYHLSPYRSTIFDCLDFKNKDAKVLELGAGCGAVTRWLGEHFKEVCAVEGGFHRAQVAHMRCRDLDNVDVHVANFLDLELLNMFDIATLIGVLEYSYMYHPKLTDSPFRAALSTLELVYEALKDKGALVLAIENKFGLKYFSGAKEDHSGRVFDSIHGYPRLDSAVTFSAAEIKDLLRKAGFSAVNFYLPFPDYKLASTIINGDEISAENYLHNWIETPFKDRCSGQRSLLFNESLVTRELIKGRMLKDLSNSFLVVAYKGDKEEVVRHLGMAKQSWVAKHYSLDRHPSHCKKVTLKKSSEESLVIENTHAVAAPGEEKNSSDVFRQNLSEEIFYRGDQLLFSVFEIIVQNDADPKFLKLIESLIQFLLDNYSSGKEDAMGVPLLKGETYDITFWNIIVEEGTGKWRVIDREWIFNGLIPVDFVVWRNLFHLILRFNSYFPEPFDHKTAKTFVIQCIRNYYTAFDEDRYDKAHEMDDYFQHYVGHGNLPCAIEQLPICRPFELHYKSQCELSPDSTDNENQYEGELIKDNALVSIIIPVHNKLEFTKQCIENLVLNTAYKPYEVIVIDNSSSDGTGEFLESLEDDVKIITNDTNLGFGRSINQGAKAAKGKYLMFLNNDTIPQPGWLDNMVKIMKERPDVAVVGSKLIYPDNTIQHAGVAFDVKDSSFCISHIYNGFDRNHIAVNHLREMNAVTAACMLVKKDLFLNIGMFDEGFMNGYEDTDFCLRVREMGHKIIYTPESELYHYEETTEQRLSYTERNNRHFLNKWMGKIKPDIHDKAKEDGLRIKYTSDKRIVYLSITAEEDHGGRSSVTDDGNGEYFRQERREIAEVIPGNVERILDVGCGEGVLGRNLLLNGASEVIGIELSQEISERAKDNLTKVICGDIENLDLEFEKKYFDCMIFADILEHVKDPLAVLKKYREFLSDSGCVVASIPNVGYYRVIDMLAQGHWTYGEYGILDRTHLRFFTRTEIETLFRSAGFEITGISSNMAEEYENLDDPYSGNISFGRVELRGLTPVEIQDLFVVQYIIRAQKTGHELKQVEKDIEEAIASNNSEEAKQMLENYLQLHSADMDMLYKHAKVCFNSGHSLEAEESLRKILLFQPHREDAMNLMSEIEKNEHESVNLNDSSQVNNKGIEENNSREVKKVAIVRGANLNKWEMQNYEPLQENFDLTAYATNQTNFDISNIKLPVIQLPFKHQGLLMEMEGLEESLADKDLVFSADITYKFSAQAVNAKQQSGCKVVCLEWENIPYNYEEYEEVHHVKETVRNGADYFIAVTERAKEALMIEGVPEEKIDVIPMGVDLNVFRPVQDGLYEEREKFGIDRDDIVVLFIGRMVWEKGIYDFLHASARICRDSMLNEKRIRFLIVGKGPELEGARERAGALGISSSTIFIEEYPYKDMYKLHNIADFFVLPSISTRSWQEQFGMVLIESMACGTPVISTYSGSIPEVVGDGGMLVQPNDHLSLYQAMKDMIANRDVREDFGKMALKRAETVFDSAKIADKVKAVFNKVISRKTEADMLQEKHDKSIKYWDQGKKEKAFSMACEILGKDPDNKNVLNSIFRMGMELEKYKTVEKSIKEYLQCHPADLEALALLAEILICLGKKEQAKAELKKIMIFDPQNGRAKLLLNQIEEKKNSVKQLS